MEFKDLIGDYSLENIRLSHFLINALLCALLSWIVAVYYNRHGNSVSNRGQFSNNFILLCLTTMLIITIVKSSIALSLGLVGALSIVRFRAAIKEPEELIYLFLVIAIGLGMGANQPEITIVAFVLIMSILIIKRALSGKHLRQGTKQMQLAISGRPIVVEKVNEVLSKNFTVVDCFFVSDSQCVVSTGYTCLKSTYCNRSK